MFGGSMRNCQTEGWVRSLVRTSFLGKDFFFGFFLICKKNVRNL